MCAVCSMIPKHRAADPQLQALSTALLIGATGILGVTIPHCMWLSKVLGYLASLALAAKNQ